jgi:hypothetical protein
VTSNAYIKILGLLVAINLMLNESMASGKVEPIPAEAVLEWNGHVWHPDSIIVDSYEEFEALNQTISVSSNTVFATVINSSNIVWTAVCSNAAHLQLITSYDKTAYFEPFQRNRWTLAPEDKPRLIRVDLGSGKFLPDLLLTTGNEPENILAATDRGDRLVVLTGNFGEDKSGNSILSRYRVTCFDMAAEKIIWSESFVAVGDNTSRPTAFLLSGNRPNQAWSSICSLSWMDDDILVCAGSRQNLLCLAEKTGKTLWTIGRVWEFQRGFIGPSVWQHYISRFGEEKRTFTNDVSVNETTSELFDKRWSCQIVGGPIIVHRPATEWETNGISIFVATSKASKEMDAGWAGYLSDCIVYELDASGTPLSMVTLPRMVKGSQARVEANSVVWSCQENGMVKMEATASDKLEGSGPGGFDRLTKIDWYRQLDHTEPKAWLVTDKAADALAFDTYRFFRVLSGGYVTEPIDKTFNLPISSVDCTNGITSELLLRVPLTGTVPAPETNYRSSGFGTKNVSYHTVGAYFLEITGLEMRGNKLAITIGMEEWHATLLFNISDDKPAGANAQSLDSGRSP